MPSSRATLVQVAERAGVSLASTSRALHGTGASKAMVERVRAAAAELGYSPDVTGRSLRMGKTSQIAFAVADIGNPVYVEMLTAIHEVVSPHGFRVVVMSTGQTAGSTVDLVRSLGSGFVDGLIVSPIRTSDDLTDAVRHAPVPVVVIGRQLGPGIDSVSTDSAAGIGQAVDHLLAIGRRRVGFVNGPLDTTPGAARQRGFDLATAAPGFAGELARTVLADDFTVGAGLEAARRLLAETAGAIDAVVAANDLLAIGAVRAAGEAGLSVPDDVAVVGMDDTELGRVFRPSLTSVSLGSAERGRAAARLMLERVGDASPQAQQVSIGPRIVVRESTAPPPAAGAAGTTTKGAVR